jgi:deazaflavin-dependent oxidoreductase (nitroreductase family)
MSETLFSVPLPKGLLAWLFKLPIGFYRIHLGSLLGDRFLLLTHTGRKTGRLHQTVVEVVQHDQDTGTFYVASGWGEKSSWYKNIMAHPQVTIQVGNREYSAMAERVSPEQGAQIILEYAREHPLALRELSRIMHYPLDGNSAAEHEASAMNFGRNVPILAFRTNPAPMKTNPLAKSSLPDGTTLFRFNGVPVKVQPAFWPLPFLVTGVLTWIAGLRRPDRSWLQRLVVGLVALPVALIADVGHAMAHTVSARLAGAPMDEILLSAEMPRTLYENNDVLPHVHILRSLGGPIFSLTCSALSLLWRNLSPRRSVSRELAEISLFGHAFILLGSIVPLPMVDGGIILKWRLVQAGRSVEEADRVVQRASLGLGAALLAVGAVLGISQKRKLVGGGLVAGGLAAIAAGMRWLK